MNAKSRTPLSIRPDLVPGILTRLAQILIVLAFEAAVMFLAAGTLRWMAAWIFIAIYVVIVPIFGLFMLRTNPETIVERSRAAGMREWDRIVSGLWFIAQYLALPLVAGLDIRWGWTGKLSAMWHVAGAVMFVIGLGIFGWAMITNAYFSTVVRLQSDRGQTVCRTGPYRLVRHPGYAGAILQSVGIPLLLGSFWALIPGLAAAAVMAARTSLEDRMLQAELPGYQEFAQEVHYRLVPGIW